MPAYTPRKSPNKKSNELVRARASITKSGNVRLGLTRYKQAAPTEELRRVLPRLLSMPAYRALVWPDPLPRQLGGLHQVGLLGHCTCVREIEWLCLSFFQHSKTINAFNKRIEEIERTFLFESEIECQRALDAFEAEFGVSMWLINQRISLLQRYAGLPAQREFAASILANDKVPSLLRYIVSWISFKAEDSISGDSFFRLLSEVRPSSSGFSDLMHVILGSCPVIDYENVGHSLAYLDILPLVDRYLYFVRFLQVLVSQDIPKTDQRHISLAIRDLAFKLDDAVIRRLYLSLGGSDSPRLLAELASVVDAYVAGDTSTVSFNARRLVEERGSIDALHLWIKSALAANVPADTSFLPEGSLIAKISEDLTRLFAYTDDAYVAASRLLKLAVTHSDASWASSITLLVRRQRRDERLLLPDVVQRFHAFHAGDDMPVLSFAYPNDAQYLYLSQFVDGANKMGAASLEAYHLLNASNLTAGNGLSLTRERTVALIALRQGRHEDAVRILEAKIERDGGIACALEVGVLLAEAYLRGNLLLKCAQVCSELCLGAEYLVHLLPISRLIQSLIAQDETCGTMSEDRADISFVIVFDLYSRFVSPSHDAERGDAFNDFLLGSKLRLPSQLKDAPGSVTQLQLRYFLRHVCVPDVLDQCYGLRSSREVEDERARILVQLSEIYNEEGQIAPANLNDELQQIRTRQVIRDTTHQLDQSKIFVDTDGIRRVVGNQIKESWARYRLMGLENSVNSSSHHIIPKLQVAGDRLSLVVSLPVTERNKLFERMFAEIRDLFASSKVYGLDANLSTNIRHGYVLREIRKPFVIAHLVTNKVTESSEYKENTYWVERTRGESASATLQAALHNLSRKVDAEIEYLINKVLRVWGDGSPEGVFDFEMSHMVLHQLQLRAEECQTSEEFFDLTFEVLWHRTNATLRGARHTLFNGTLRRLNSAVAELEKELEEGSFDEDPSALITAVNLVRPEVRSAVERVASWFTLSGSRDYQDYALRIAYDAALATVETYYNDIEINTDFDVPHGLLLRGWTLPHLTRLFSNLLENVAKHSQITEGAVAITCCVVLDKEYLSLKLSNSLAPSIDRTALENKIASINSDYGKDAVPSLVAKEGGSGYPKIWKILTHDLRRDHDLEVCLNDNDNFSVEMLLDSRGVVL